METIDILHALQEARAQILHLQEMYNEAMERDSNHTLGTTDDALRVIDRTIDALKKER